MERPSPAPELISFDSFVIPEIDPVTPLITQPAEPTTPAADTTAPVVVPQDPATEPQRTAWSNLLLSFKEVDKALPDTLEIPDDLTAEGMKALLYKTLKEQALAEVTPDAEKLSAQEYNKLIEKGYTAEQIENALFLSENISQGVQPSAVQRYNYLKSLSEYELSNEGEELQLLRIYLSDLRGQDPEIVETHLTTKLAGEANAAARKQAVTDAQKNIVDLRESEFIAEQEAAKEAREQSKLDRKRENDNLAQVIDSGFMGIKLQPEEAAKFKKAMFEIDSYRDIQTPQGVQRIPETAEAKAWRAIMADPAKRVAFAYIAINGIEKLTNTAVIKTSDNFIKAIEQNNLVPSILDTPVPPASAPTRDRKGFVLPI